MLGQNFPTSPADQAWVKRATLLTMEEYRRHWAPFLSDPQGATLPMRGQRIATIAWNLHYARQPRPFAFRDVPKRKVTTEGVNIERMVRTAAKAPKFSDGDMQAIGQQLDLLSRNSINSYAAKGVITANYGYAASPNNLHVLKTQIGRLALGKDHIRTTARAAQSGRPGAPRNRGMRVLVEQMARDFEELRCEAPFNRKPNARSGFSPAVKQICGLLDISGARDILPLVELDWESKVKSG